MIRKHLKLLLRFAIVSFRDMSEFRLDFFTSILHNLIYQAIFIIFWKSILTYTSNVLGEWTFPDLVVLSAFTLLSTSVMQWLRGFLRLSAKVVHGELDKYLCKPVSPLFAMLAEEMRGLSSVQQSFSALIILLTVSLYYGIHPGFLGVVGSLAVLAVGCLVAILIQGSISLLSFWLGDVSRINRLFMITGEFERYPLTIFPLWLQGFLTWVIPIGLISTYPVLVFLGKTGTALHYLGIGLLLTILWGTLFYGIWRRAVGRYESFGG